MKKFEILDIAGDAGIRAFGGSKQEVFLHAALGMYSLITDTKFLKDQTSITVSAESDTLDGLLVAWLNELVFHFDAYGFIGKEIKVLNFSDNRIEARLAGEEFDPERHQAGLLIKAATYHQLKIEKKEHSWEAEIIFDV
jgi:SHS2 domain-containing protein